MRRIFTCLAIMAMFTGPLHAEERSVESRLYLERGQGPERIVSEARTLRRGDRVVAMLDWSHSPIHAETMTSAIPAHLSFLAASLDELEVSRDGGRSWSHPDSNAAGRVTHLRWPAGAARRLAYSAIVR